MLSRVDAGDASLGRRISYYQSQLVTCLPVTEKHADDKGMTLGGLCEATLTTSDNTAANLILESCCGPAALSKFAKSLGDDVTPLDRMETALNVKQGEVLLDSTSPRAMARTMQKVLAGDALSADFRHTLQQWLLANTTGGKRIKAGLPSHWRIGDKTGTNATDTNDIGVVWSPDQAPWLVAAYLADSEASNPSREAALALASTLVGDLAS